MILGVPIHSIPYGSRIHAFIQPQVISLPAGHYLCIWEVVTIVVYSYITSRCGAIQFTFMQYYHNNIGTRVTSFI